MTTLTPVELAIMKSLWQRRSASVRDVQRDLLSDRGLAYTTVMTVLDRLFRKGMVRRRKKSRAHIYEPVFSEAAMRSAAVAGLIDAYFDGSARALSAFLNEDEGTDEGVAARETPAPASVPTMDESLL